MRHIPFHGLRHSAATLLLARGLTLGQIQKILGHTTVKLTADLYSHHVRDLADQAAAEMEALFGSGKAASRRSVTEVCTMRVMLDSMIFDRLVEDDAAAENLRRATVDGRVQLVTTHIQRDQLAETPDEDKRAMLLGLLDEIPFEVVLTRGAVYGISRYGMAKWGSGAQVEKLRAENRKPSPTRDALIAATAADDADVLVTEDERLTRRLRRLIPALQVWSFAAFAQYLDMH